MKEQQFAELVDVTHGPLRAYIAACGVSSSEIDDVAQESYLALLRDPPPPGVEPLRWLKGIARHRCLRVLTGRRQRTAPVEDIVSLLEARIVPLEEVDDDAKLDALRRCLAGLDERRRNFATRYYDPAGGPEQLAGESGSSVGAVHMAMMRLRDLLRRCVEGRLPGLRR